MPSWNSLSHLFRAAYETWSSHKASRLGAALAYYAMFSLAPLIVLAISVSGIVFGKAAAQGQISRQIQDAVGVEAAQAIQDMVVHASAHGTSLLAGIFGIGMLLLGAAGLFGQLQDAMNAIWDVEPKPGGGWMAFVKDRILLFAMVLGTCILLLASLLVSAGMLGLAQLAGSQIKISAILPLLDIVISLMTTTVLFAMLFRFLPNTRIGWRDVWFGGFVTAVLFVIGKVVLGFYFAQTAVVASYGAAGSLMLILLWIYYAAQIFFFGAELTRAYAERHGTRAN